MELDELAIRNQFILFFFPQWYVFFFFFKKKPLNSLLIANKAAIYYRMELRMVWMQEMHASFGRYSVDDKLQYMGEELSSIKSYSL